MLVGIRNRIIKIWLLKLNQVIFNISWKKWKIDWSVIQYLNRAYLMLDCRIIEIGIIGVNRYFIAILKSNSKNLMNLKKNSKNKFIFLYLHVDHFVW